MEWTRTTLTLGTVMDDSAMLVDRMTWGLDIAIVGRDRNQAYTASSSSDTRG